MDFCSEYDFELNYVARKLRESNSKRVLIQLPDGFLRCFTKIEDVLRNALGRDIEVVLSLNPSYGPCLVDEATAIYMGADAIVHFGHTEYPLYKPSVKTLYVPVEFKSVDRDKISSLLSSLCQRGEKICVVSTSQHIKILKGIDISGECIYEYRGVVYGCIPADVRECDMLVVIAGGRFNCISQGLALRGKYPELAIYCVDPYSYTLWRPDEEIRRLLKIRMWKISTAVHRRRWLVVSGFYGQARQNLVDLLISILESSGYSVSKARALKLDRDTIINLGEGFDVIVVASCPYIAFDLQDLEVPVLTVGEAIMAVKGITDRYVYPW